MTSMNKLPAALSVLCLVVFLGAGCDAAAPGGRAPAPGFAVTSRPISLISPVEFFPPEQKRLERHLGWHVGSFKVEYAGPTATLASRLETWSQGRPEPRGGSSGSMEAGMGEVSISVQETAGGSPHYKVKLVQSSDTGSVSSGGGYNRPDFQGWSTRVAKIQNPIELKPGEEIPIWALCLFKGGINSDTGNSSESVFDQVKKSDWALVLRVGLNPPGK